MNFFSNKLNELQTVRFVAIGALLLMQSFGEHNGVAGSHIFPTTTTTAGSISMSRILNKTTSPAIAGGPTAKSTISLQSQQSKRLQTPPPCNHMLAAAHHKSKVNHNGNSTNRLASRHEYAYEHDHKHDHDYNQLDAIEKKFTKFELNNLAFLQRLSVQNLDLLKRFDVMERSQHALRHAFDKLLNEFMERKPACGESRGGISNYTNYTEDPTNESHRIRQTRHTLMQQQQQQQQQQQHYHHQQQQQRPEEPQQRQQRQSLLQSPTQTQMANSMSSISNGQKLDALATLLVSTRTALSQLNSQLQANFSNLLQQTDGLHRRFNSLLRRQHQQQQQRHLYSPAGVSSVSPANGAAGYPSILPANCAQGGYPVNGILQVQVAAVSQPFYVHCDDEEYGEFVGGGWTVIMNRFNGDINFERDWLEYKRGFGNLAGEFFIGLEKLHALTAVSVHELLIVLTDFQDNRKYAKYNLFAIGSEHELYDLKLLGTYAGDAGDSLTYHAGYKFSTYDNDNDGCVNCNCAQSHRGGWWYNWCDESNLMGPYHDVNYDNIEQYRGIYWQHWLGPKYSLKAVKMLIRPVQTLQDSLTL